MLTSLHTLNHTDIVCTLMPRSGIKLHIGLKPITYQMIVHGWTFISVDTWSVTNHLTNHALLPYSNSADCQLTHHMLTTECYSVKIFFFFFSHDLIMCPSYEVLIFSKQRNTFGVAFSQQLKGVFFPKTHSVIFNPLLDNVFAFIAIYGKFFNFNLILNS